MSGNVLSNEDIGVRQQSLELSPRMCKNMWCTILFDLVDLLKSWNSRERYEYNIQFERGQKPR